METEEWLLILAFFGLLAFLAFLATRRNATATAAGAPYLLLEKDDQGRIINIQPSY